MTVAEAVSKLSFDIFYKFCEWLQPPITTILWYPPHCKRMKSWLIHLLLLPWFTIYTLSCYTIINAALLILLALLSFTGVSGSLPQRCHNLSYATIKKRSWISPTNYLYMLYLIVYVAYIHWSITFCWLEAHESSWIHVIDTCLLS